VLPGDLVSYNGTLSQYLQLDQNAIPNDNVTTVSVYRAAYRAINSANSIIAVAPSLEDPLLSSAERNRILGEAYFIRALSYFDLARGWGGVQLQLAPTTDLSVIKGIRRSTLSATYDQVLSDLTTAESLLPAEVVTRNRADRGAVYGLRARLHLYREQWSEAEEYATRVISNTSYSLVTPFGLFFTAPFLSSESVFELTFTLNDRNSYWNLWYPASLGGQYTLKPSDKLIALLRDPAIGGDRVSLLAGEGDNVYGTLYNTAGQSIDPGYVLRLSELYLIRAESRLRRSSPDILGAISDLNVIRARAGATLWDSGDGDITRLLRAIEDENGIEFAFEAHRWFDLVRTGRAGEVLGITNTDFWLFPLPSSDILSDDDVDQNPGY
jgi:hypothetical protein